MSTPEFAPAIQSTIPTHHTDTYIQHSPRYTLVKSASSASSPPSSAASSVGSFSPNALTSSSTLSSESGRTRSSIATTASPGEIGSKGHSHTGSKVLATEMESDQNLTRAPPISTESMSNLSRDRSQLIMEETAPVNMARLSMHENEAPEGSAAAASSSNSNLHPEDAATQNSFTSSSTSKTRRASTLSSSSSSTHYTPQHSLDTDPNARSNGKGGRSPSKPARRKAARIGSFGPAPSAETDASTSNVPNEHVDIVNYPSTDLLKLLANLLQQIAHANDALHQRINSGSNTPGANLGGHAQEDSEESASSWVTGRFDAAPLNSPATPRYRRASLSRNDETENSAETEETSTNSMMEMPVTPGVDLLREVGVGGGVEGFMPSLGGTHAPLPLTRRRGSSFLKKLHPESTNSSMPPPPAVARRTSQTPKENSANNSLTPQSAVPNLPGPAEPPSTSLLTASSVALSSASASLCFHARNIPAISIEAYLLRILKYCPTTNEVFLSLLVYFDRMARVGLEAQRMGLTGTTNTATSSPQTDKGTTTPPTVSRLFAIDSFNVHRLVIAGVTVASKFFSDVFYTNSRYAKVGGLPLHELNQLELQFLLLNDFRLVIPLDELQRYADQLILYWIGRNPTTGQSNQPHPSQQTPTSPVANPPKPNPPPSQTPIPAGTTAPVLTEALTTSNGQGTEFSTPRTSAYTPQHHPGSASTQSRDPTQRNYRPSSIRSQPSSSGASVSSTITPGTPSTPRKGDSSTNNSENEEDAADNDGNQSDEEKESGDVKMSED